jgi:hypothetical protein
MNRILEREIHDRWEELFGSRHNSSIPYTFRRHGVHSEHCSHCPVLAGQPCPEPCDRHYETLQAERAADGVTVTE